MLDWLKERWFLLTALVAVSAAWGEQRMKIVTVEDAVKQTQTTAAQVNTLNGKVERVDERTVQMLESQRRLESRVELLIQAVQRPRHASTVER